MFISGSLFVRLYVIALPVFLIIDAIWLGVIARKFYAGQLGHIMKTNVNWTAAAIFYLLFIAGLVVFVIGPALESDLWMHAVIAGALFGLITYATYDLTNLATIKDWPLLVTIVDLVWGTVLAGLVSVISFLIANRLGL